MCGPACPSNFKELRDILVEYGGDGRIEAKFYIISDVFSLT